MRDGNAGEDDGERWQRCGWRQTAGCAVVADGRARCEQVALVLLVVLVLLALLVLLVVLEPMVKWAAAGYVC